MDLKTRKILTWAGVAVFVIAGIAMLLLSFRGPDETAQVDVDAIYTNAAATVFSQQQTLQAGTVVAQPSPTPNLPTPTLPQLLSPTAQLQTPIQLPTTRPLVTTVSTLCDNAVYVSDVTIPDGTVIPAGQNFTKTWKVTNTGTCAWTATYKLTFISGDSLGGKATPINQVVNPGQSVDVSVVLTSTSATGTITGRWKLTNDKGQPFGDELTVVIKNSVTATGTVSVTPTRTSTPTVTPVVIVVTATYTPTPTTAAPTNTPAPTETPIPTPTGTTP